MNAFWIWAAIVGWVIVIVQNFMNIVNFFNSIIDLFKTDTK